MLRVVANHAKNHVRSRTRRLQRDDHHARLAEARVDDATADAVERRLEHEELAAALQRLPDRDREVVGCRYIVGLTEAETAEVLGVPTGTVKSRLSRALAHLADELSGDTGTGDGR
jgi:RNA polymerase sigma-70 factor (ECF subfamily)